MSALDGTATARRSSWFGSDGWHQAATLSLLDLRVAVHSDDPALVALIEALFAPTLTDADPEHDLFLGRARVGTDSGYFAAADGGALVRTPAPGVAFRHLVFEANQMAIDVTTTAVRLHSAAVARAGLAVAIVGPMGAGKSTLAAGLVRRGWDYLTDEVVAIDDVARVRPYAKPCSLGDPPAALALGPWTAPSGATGYLGGSGLVPAAVLGSVADGPAALRAVVLPTYRRGGSTTIAEIDPVDALVDIGAHAFGLDEPGALGRLYDAVRALPCFRLSTGDLHAACDAVEAAVAPVLRAAP